MTTTPSALSRAKAGRSAATDKGTAFGPNEMRVDPVRVQILDRAAVDLALSTRMFGQVRDALKFRNSGGQVTAQQVIVERGPGRVPLLLFFTVVSHMFC